VFPEGRIDIRSGKVHMADISMSSAADGECGIQIEDGSCVSLDDGYISGCSNYEAGALDSVDSAIQVSDTVFVNNVTADNTGGAVTVGGYEDDATFTNCIFYNNGSTYDLQDETDEFFGGALSAAATFDDCVFLNDDIPGGGGGLRGALEMRDSIVFAERVLGRLSASRSLFASADISTEYVAELADVAMIGWGLTCTGSDAQASLRNVTAPGLFVEDGCAADVRGSIILGEIYGDATVSYSYVSGGHEGEGNISSDPFPGGYTVSSGTWTDVYFDEGLFQTEFTDETASWEPGELAGMFLLPDTLDMSVRAMVIADNSDTAIWAWGNAITYNSTVVTGDPYSIIDLHLPEGSPAIDAGYGLWASATDADGFPRYDDPGSPNAFDCDSEPDCLEYADMGAYEYQP
jgi:hypothetical protein